MPPLSNALLFTAATVALLLMPGPAVVYIVTRSVAQGRTAGLVSVLGIHVGTLFYVVATALGLSALLSASSTAFHVVKYLGAAYLIWLGIEKLRLSRDGAASTGEPPPSSMNRVFGQGVVVALLNPKTMIFFAAFLPQFLDPARGSLGTQIAFFCALFVALGVLSDGTYAVLASALAGKIRRTARRRRTLEVSSGVVYVLLGVFAGTLSQA